MRLLKSINLLEEADKVQVCRQCPQLCASRTQTVYARGNPDAPLMIIGEAPGADEDKKGEPFVGRAGQLLDNIIAACGLKQEDVYICNVIKCRPPKNRVPDILEIQNCRGYLDRQIDIVNPKFILCLGSVASGTLTGMPISQARLNRHEYRDRTVFCTYHPAYLLRNPDAKVKVREDLQPLLMELKNVGSEEGKKEGKRAG